MQLNRNDLQNLARLRLRDARSLLRAQSFSGVYYIAGYAIECGLKACIAKKTRRHDFPDKSFATLCFTHELAPLVRAAGLDQTLQNAVAADQTFAVNWAIVKDWKVAARYQSYTESEARDLYGAIAARTHGVMQWLRQSW